MSSRWFSSSTPAIQLGDLVRQLTAPVIASLIGVITTSQPGHAVSFNFNYDDQAPQHMITAFEDAGSIWAGYLQDDVTLNIDVSYGELPDGMLGGARPDMVMVNWSDALQQFDLDQTSSDDRTAFEHLKSIQKIYKGPRKGKTLFDASSSLWLTQANAKALGIVTSSDLVSDGEIRLSDSALWDFDPSDDIASDHYDFLGTALHEIGHILGVVSGVDTLDLYQQTQTSVSEGSEADPIHITTMDLFRHSNKTKDTHKRDWSLDDREKYFSLDDGINKIVEFSNGLSTEGSSGGYQASHWKVGINGIMQPSIDPGERNIVTPIDLQLVDALGWDLTGDSNVDYSNSSVSYVAYDDSFDGLLSRGRSSFGNAGYRYWQTSLASFANNSSESQPVPEPMSMLALLGLGTICVGTSLLKKSRS